MANAAATKVNVNTYISIRYVALLLFLINGIDCFQIQMDWFPKKFKNEIIKSSKSVHSTLRRSRFKLIE